MFRIVNTSSNVFHATSLYEVCGIHSKSLYGRFNPPHKGHRLMIEQVIETARKSNKTPVVVVSHSTGNTKNPLPVENKMRILKRWFPNVTIVSSAKNRSIAKITENFNQNSIMVVGANRQNSFKFLPFKKVAVPRSNTAPSATMARAAATLLVTRMHSKI